MFFSSVWKMSLLTACMLVAINTVSFCGDNSDSAVKNKKSGSKYITQQRIWLEDFLLVFDPVQKNDEYSIAICTDLPDKDNPKLVYKKGETGHVFLILAKHESATGKTVSRSFGFYPRWEVSCLAKQVKSKIRDNSNREYDAYLEKKITADEFAFILQQCKEFAGKKYNLKKFNCYDYAIEVFNSLPGIEKLPVTDIKFPFLFGRGGSPCGLFADLKKLKETNSAWAAFIRMGLFTSPPNELFIDQIVSH